MPIEHSKRLAWFRQLQRIMRFPTTFLAPKHPGFRTRHSIANDFEPPVSSTFGTAPDQGPAAGPRRKTAVDVRAPKLSLKPTTGFAAAGKVSVMPVNLTAALRSLRAQQPRWAAKPAVSTLTGRATAQSSKRNTLEAQSTVPSPPPLHEAELSMIRPETRQSSAHVLPLSRPSRTSNLRGHPPYPSSDLGFDPMLRAQPPAADYATAEEPFREVTSRPDPFTSSEASGDEARSRATGQTSTVHIDGSVLGRWAIQHLERVLGRPSIGMTGVDPRVNAPRSRVSPF